MDSLVVINSKWFEHGDQAADWIEPVGIVHRSGVHLLVCHTRNTPPTVDVNRRWLFGDHLANAQGMPIRFKGIFRFVSTSQIMAFGSLKLTDTSNDPFRFHSSELIGWWCVLYIFSQKKSQSVEVSKYCKMINRKYYLVKCKNCDVCRPGVSNLQIIMPLLQPTANSPAQSGRHASDVIHFW